MFVKRVLALVVGLAVLGPLPLLADGGSWKVALNKRQAKAFEETKAQPSITAFALSPDGAWGRAWDYDTKKAASARALAGCRGFLKPGRRDCILFAVDGVIVAEPVVKTRVVSKVYKPINGKTAPAFFGRAAVNFTGNKAAAVADYKALEKAPSHRGRLARDKKLEAALMKRSFMNTQHRAFAIWFEAGHGAQHSKANSGILRTDFGEWVATKDGLVCMFDSVSDSGKRYGTRCLIIHEIENGSARFSWADHPGTKYKGQIIAGDARYGAAK
jgi:hypothetical protein